MVKRLARALLVLAILPALGGCVGMSWCWCDDPVASPVEPGKDGRSST